MKITKYQHACFVVEHEGESLVVDPGGWTNDLTVPANTIAVVITHEHQDHIDKKRLQSIIDSNPNTTILTTASVATQLDDFKTQTIDPGDKVTFGSFNLEFFGGQHAQISPDIPAIPNVGVMINDYLYYPGDSFAAPEKPVHALAIPAAAPWMKFSEAAGFLTVTEPKVVFPTHDAILSDEGKQLADRMLGAVAEKTGARYERLPFGVATEI